jgi:hypothetical protein
MSAIPALITLVVAVVVTAITLKTPKRTSPQPAPSRRRPGRR